ncbi:S8 family peptidase [Ekhidna sp.]|uniref:S8 family peptidase n=1 Tax=Ekhidna sp. TaxID=2608089 RepID=UPI003296B2FE
MRGILFGVLLIIWWSTAWSQETDNWKQFLRGNEGEQGHFKVTGDYMLEGSRFDVLEAYPTIKILRSIDDTHHIVRTYGDPAKEIDGLRSVNNDWKLFIKQNASKDQFYVLTTHADKSLLNPFKIIRSYPSSNTFLIQGSLKDIKTELLPRREIISISNDVFMPSVEARVIDMNLNPNRVNKVQHYFPSLTGEAEIISIQENRFDVDDIDLLNRSVLTGLESSIVDNHATEMATIIAGKGNSFITGKGVAPNASISSSDFFDAMPDDDQSYLDLNINVQNHSYGIVKTSEYGIQARAFDQSAFSNKNLLHVFSSGNDGLAVSTDGRYAEIEGFANLTGNIKMSKNTLVVGSVDTVGNIPAFISRGPAYDGRVKPELVAYSVVGSSNSAALVSGVSSLLHQQYRISYAGADMPSALAKALLINGAEDVGPKGLDFLTGYGNVNAWESLDILLDGNFLVDTISSGETKTHALSLPPNARNLKITVCWTDPPANVGDFTALVNNLDLRLVGSTNTLLPWVLDSSPSVQELSKEAIRGIDNLNNVEQITVDDPEISYTIQVEGTNLISDQEYYIVWHYEVEDSFEWDYPTGSDNMPYNGETGSYFRWSTTFDSNGELAYTLDEVDWTVLNANVNLSDGYWRWHNPPMLNNQVKARMTIDGVPYETDFFTVSEPLSPSVGFNCADSLMIKWNESTNATNYDIYVLGEEELEEYATTSDTFLIVANKSLLSGQQLSIQPELSSGSQLLPTQTFDYTRQGIECYVASFFQTVALDTGIYLNLSLGTSYGIEEIVFQRSEFDGFVQVASITNIVSDQVDFLDSSPNQGYNEHRAIITFINGQELVLSAGSSYYLTDIPLRIFPNPASYGEPLIIITKEFEDRTPLLELMSAKGDLVHKQTVEGSQDDIPTGGLQPGIYYYRLTADNQTYSGRILIR